MTNSIFNMNKLTLIIASLTLAACGGGSDNSDTTLTKTEPPIAATGPGPFTFAIKTTGEGEPEFLMTQDFLLNEPLIATDSGYQQQGYNFFYPVGNTLFVSGSTNLAVTSYAVNTSNNVEKLTSFDVSKPLTLFGHVEDQLLLATDIPRGSDHSKRILCSIDANTGELVNTINYSIYDIDTGTIGEGIIGSPTALMVRDNLLFVPFHKLSDVGNFSTPMPDSADIAIYEYPLANNAQPQKIISDTRTSHIGVYESTTSMIKTDNGDLYTMSNGSAAAGFSPGSTKPSAILRINRGETEFDANYFFNIEIASEGGKIFWFDYIGENKAIARIITDDYDAKGWSAFTKDLIKQKLVIIDLVSQTITDVAGVPLHQKRHTSPVEVIDGKVYMSIETADDAFVYQVDINSATAIKGVEIQGKTIKGFYDLYH